MEQMKSPIRECLRFKREKQWINSFISRGIDEEDLDNLTEAVMVALLSLEKKLKNTKK